MTLEKETIELTTDEKQLLRTALDNEIVRLLRLHKEWRPYNEANYVMYQKLGGYFTKQNFESIAKVKIRKGGTQ